MLLLNTDHIKMNVNFILQACSSLSGFKFYVYQTPSVFLLSVGTRLRNACRIRL
jgi:hypothetical protein